MKNYKKIAVCLLLVTASTVWPSTFFIATHIQIPFEVLENETKLRVVSLETGVMDYLFDNNHIFFNSYSIDSSEEDNFSLSQMLAVARKIGADYLVEITPKETGAAWNLYSVGNDTITKKFYEDINQEDVGTNEREQWMNLGYKLGQNLLDALVHQ